MPTLFCVNVLAMHFLAMQIATQILNGFFLILFELAHLNWLILPQYSHPESHPATTATASALAPSCPDAPESQFFFSMQGITDLAPVRTGYSLPEIG
jgi:hypothetical protein